MTTDFDVHDPPPRKVWMNVYADGNISGFYETRQQAEYYIPNGWPTHQRTTREAWLVFLPPTGDEAS